MPSNIGHEGDDIRTGWVMLAAAGIAVLIPLIMLGVWLDYRLLAKDHYAGLTAPTLRNPVSEPTITYPQPQLEKNPGEQLAAMRAEAEEKLNSYGWVNATNGVVRIPIDRAMDLLAQRGLPVRGTNGYGVGPSEYDLTTQRRLDSNEAPIKEIK